MDGQWIGGDGSYPRGDESQTGGDESYMMDIRHIGLMIGFELLRHFRRKRVYVVLVLSLFFSLIFYVIAKIANFNMPDESNEFILINLISVNFFIIIIVSVFGGDSVSGDFQRKTGLLLFTSPQHRISIFLGKYLASLLAVYTFITIIYLITTVEVLELYGAEGLTLEFVQSYLIALLYSASVLALIFFFSCIMKSTTTSSIVGFFFLFLIMPMLSSIIWISDNEPWFMITQHSGWIFYILFIGDDSHRYSGISELSVALAVMIAYIVLLVPWGIVLASRRQVD